MTPSFKIDEEAVRKLAAILEETNLVEIEYKDKDLSIRVSRQQSTHVLSSPAVMLPSSDSVVPKQLNPTSESTAPLPRQSEGILKSPMVGTVYLSSAPSAAPFVQIGDLVTAGQTVIIIEAMKVMNQVKASHSGKITHLLVYDGQPVEYGTDLMIIETV